MLHPTTKRMILYLAVTLFSVLTLTMPCYAAVIFEDSFDSKPDWNASGQQEGKECISSQGACSATDYPVGYNFFRAMKGDPSLTSPPSIRNLPGSLPDHTGTGTGKAFIVYNHSAAGTWPGDGYIGKYFDTATYPDLYVRFWIRTQSGWQDMAGTPQSKLLRLGSWNGSGNAFSWDYPQAPAVFFDWGAYAGYASWITAYRCDNSSNTYYCSNSVNSYQKMDIFQDWGTNQTPTNKYADTGWHRYDIHIKYNSAPGTADGIMEFKYDGVNVAGNGSSSGNYPETNVVLREAGSNKTGFNIIAIGGNSNNKWNTSPAKEQWYAIDDFVVSTTPIPDNYAIGGGTAADTTAPTVSISSPANNAAVSGTVSVTVNASDSVGVSKVEYYVNGTLKGTDTSTPYVYSWDTSAVAAGTYSLMAKAYDAAGNVRQSGTVSVSVVKDTTIPTVSLTSPAKNATVSGTVTITASAADNVGVSKVEYYKNNVLLAAGNVAPYSSSWNTTSESNGTHTITAKAYDATGNIGQSSAVSVTVNNAAADTTAPSTSITSPAASATVSGTVTFTASASDNVGVSTVEYYRNGVRVAHGSVAPYTYKWDTTSVSSGAYSFITKAYDGAGNVGQSVAKVITVNNTGADTTAPTTSITSPAANASVSGTVNITASATDNVGVSKVEFYVNSVLKATDTTAPYSYSWDSKSVVNGSYSITTKAYDAAGNMKQSAAVAVNKVGQLTLPPAPSPINPVSSGISTTPTYTFSAIPGANYYAISLWDNTLGTNVYTAYTPTQANCSSGTGNCTVAQVTPLKTGHSYSWFVLAQNAAGIGPWSANTQFTVAQLTLPPAPSPINPVSSGISTTPTYTFSAIPGANYYAISLWDNTLGTNVYTAYTPTQANCSSGTGNCTVAQVTPLKTGHSYSWFVLAQNAVGIGPWSTNTTFIVR